MQVREVDVAIIGAGTAGMTAYRIAREHTDNLLVIESSHYGTTCARVGCMPSKLLIAAAEVNHQIGEAGKFGIDVSSSTVDGARVMARVKAERDRFVGFVEEAVDDWPAEHKLWGKAKFVGPNELMVDGGVRVIGLEISQALSRLGVRVHLFGVGNKFGPISDPFINAEAKKIFEAELNVSADARVDSAERTEQGVRVTYSEKGEQKVAEFACLLAATGRRSNLDELNLKEAGVTLNDRGMPAFNEATGQIEDKPLFIAGDVSNAHPLLHEAADDGRIAGDNAGSFPVIRARPRRAPLSVVFTDPQIALVGARFSDLDNSTTSFAVGQVSFEDQGRSRVIGKNKGILRVYGEQGTGVFLGAEMIGPAAEHLGHLLSWSVQHRLTVQQMLDSPFYHPVIEEGVRTALRQLNREMRMGPVPVEGCLDCGPGA